MDFKRFMSRLRAQTGFHFRDDTGRMSRNTYDDEEEEDVMFEGFVVVEDKAEERTSVVDLPTCSSAMMVGCEKENVHGVHYSSTLLTTSQGSINHPSTSSSGLQQSSEPVVHGQISPVADIPFELHPSLCAQQYVLKLFQGIDLRTHAFKEKMYSHDFTHENECLRDLDC